jgi:hypothetical protein
VRFLSIPAKLIFYFSASLIATLFLMNDAMSNGTLPLKNPELKPLDAILTYCDTKEIINKMAKDDYRMLLAARGTVHNHFHKELVETQLWINPSNNQWAIMFKYKDKDLSCIVGGNNVELFTPGEDNSI